VRTRRFQRRRDHDLAPDTVLFAGVERYTRGGWSRAQIAGTRQKPVSRTSEQAEQQVSHEAIYNALYLLPRGALRATLIRGSLWQWRGCRSRAPVT
jgi:transposase, IS30 family